MDSNNQPWNCILERIKQIKALSDDIIININDDRNHGRILPQAIKYDENKVWVQVNNNTTLTLFMKSDYSALSTLNKTGSQRLAQKEIAAVFEFSKLVSIESVLDDW